MPLGYRYRPESATFEFELKFKNVFSKSLVCHSLSNKNLELLHDTFTNLKGFPMVHNKTFPVCVFNKILTSRELVIALSVRS